MASVTAKAFQATFEKVLAKGGRLTEHDVDQLVKAAKKISDTKEKRAADDVLALVKNDRVLDRDEVEPARKALCRLLGVSAKGLPVTLERVLKHAVPVPNVAVKDYDLTFDFNDEKKPNSAVSFPARAIITLEKAAPKRAVLEIDPERLEIEEVRALGRRVPFDVTTGRLTVEAPGAVKLDIKYRVKPTDDVDGYGLVRDRYANRMWTLTWPYNTGALFPSSSRPWDGATARVTVHVKRGVEVVGAGKRHHGEYKLDNPVPAYAIAFYTGKFSDDRTAQRGEHEATTRGLGKATSAKLRKEVREHVVEAMDYFSKWLGKYPYGDRMNLVEIKSEYGGMEHAGAVAIGVHQHEADTLEAAVHEAAHSWFGDGVRIRHWGELWMSEGFTNYITFRFFQKHDGDGEFHRLLDHAKETLREQLDERMQPLTGGRETDPKDGLSWVPYMQGVWMLRMMETEIGRPKFDKLLRDWFQANRFDSVTTKDFASFVKREVGFDAAKFFKRWNELDRMPTLIDRSVIDGQQVKLQLKAKDERAATLQIPVVIEGHRGQRRLELVTPGEPLNVDAGFNIKRITWDPDRRVLCDVV